jgi:DNA mismatch repair protein MutS
MKQYRRIKAEMPPDVILFFRLGDFYEMFFEDAKIAAPILEISLTKRHKVPMCGVPFHSADNYLGKLIKAGRKIAICEQVEEPGATRGIVDRQITRVVTPGTVLEEAMLESNQHNFLGSVYAQSDCYGLALIDLSTGTFVAEKTLTLEGLRESLVRASPAECLIPSEQTDIQDLKSMLASCVGMHVSEAEDWTFDYDAARDYLVRHFNVHSLEGFGCDGDAVVVGAAGGALYHVKQSLRREVDHVTSLRVQEAAGFLLLDDATCKNLDLVPTRNRDSGVSLLNVIDVTQTAMGGRKIREWLLQPLCDLEAITQRHDVVEALSSDRPLLSSLRSALSGVRDLERLVVRVASGGGNGRDLRSIGLSIEALPAIREVIKKSERPLLRSIRDTIHALPELTEAIASALVDEPPITVKEGGVIREGYNQELDEFRRAAGEGRQWLAEYQAKEQARTDIKNLKIRHNKVFGYYIEVSKGQLANVPDDYNRKQTLVNAERFITPELKEYETRVFGAQDKAIALEYELFLDVRDRVVAESERIRESADAVAVLDVLCAFAERALSMRYVRPEMTCDNALLIKDGRHPVVEQMPDAERFVPNDTELDCGANQLMIITGPNMAGKSTYIRQVALITIMAHMGGFVPASTATIAVVDRVFTRVGANDDLARGRSTFLVEMQETANILNNATPRSLIILDEIGRGTSTFDGISIAWAVVEHLHNNASVKAKTLFATHYHELIDLARTLHGVQNYNVLVKERNDKIAFLRKIVRGGADKSYGIQVARLAGLPDPVIVRSREILANLEEGEFAETGQPKIAKKRSKPVDSPSDQMDLFASQALESEAD